MIYVGVVSEDLIEIYILFIRSLTEYCSSSFHSSLNLRLVQKLKAVQCRVILGDMYISHMAALEMCGLDTLFTRRENRSLLFALKCTKHIINTAMFPENNSLDTHSIRQTEKFEVNKARTEAYKISTIPYLQRRLNSHFKKKEKLEETKRRAA